MSFDSLLYQLWRLRYFIILSAALCAGASAIFVKIIPKRYIATAGVTINTNVENNADRYSVSRKFLDPFVTTQAAIIKDIRVTGAVVDQLRWTESFALAQEYQSFGRKSGLDFRAWLGTRIADSTLLTFEENSPTFTVGYVGSSPEEAKGMVELLRRAYVDYSVKGVREEAERNQAWIETRLESLRKQISTIEKRNSEYGRDNDVVIGPNGLSLTEMRLRDAQFVPVNEQKSPVEAAQPTALATELADLDTEIANLAVTLGPNHPRLQALRAKRSQFAAEANDIASAPAVTPRPINENTERNAESEYLAKANAIQTAKQFRDELSALETQFEQLSARKQALILDSTTSRPTAVSDGPVQATGQVFYPRREFAIVGAGIFGALLAAVLGVFIITKTGRVGVSTDLAHLDIPYLGSTRVSPRPVL